MLRNRSKLDQAGWHDRCHSVGAAACNADRLRRQTFEQLIQGWRLA